MFLEIFALAWMGVVAGFSQTPFPPLTITRQNNGDLISLTNSSLECTEEFCIGLTSGTGALDRTNQNKGCTCQCHNYLPAFREDLNICVDDVQETVLAQFVGGTTSQLIPFVFLPLKGQLIYPSKEISFKGLQTPVCAVSKAKFLTPMGWMELRNPVNGDVPFRLYRDEGRSFLQWDGEPDLRMRLSGRMILVNLKCREASEVKNSAAKIVSPSVAFRIVGTPVNNPFLYNVSEVSFTANSHTSLDSSDSLSAPEYVAIGICSVLLGLIYVSSVFLYLHIRKRRRLRSEKNLGNDGKDDPHSLAEEGIVKSNPLLGLSAHFQIQDSEGTVSDNEGSSDIIQRDERKNHGKFTSAVIHPNQTFPKYITHHFELSLQESSAIECLPEENVSIVETLEGREDKSESLRSLNGTVRRKLYFNPAYFEPHLLVAPPPAALEFLQKIREVICIAKQKLESKKFVPNLLGIPEEDYGINIHSHSFSPPSRSGSIISLKRENSRRKNCSGCPGCQPNHSIPRTSDLLVLAPCNNCAPVSHDVKQRSIRKWLEDIPLDKNNIDKSIDVHPKMPRRIRSPASEKMFPSTNRMNSRNESRKINIRGRSPTRSLSPDFGRASARSISPFVLSDKASESDCSGSETYNKNKPIRRRQGNRIKKPKFPPPLPPGGGVLKSKSVENIYDTVANENSQPVPNNVIIASGENEEIKIPTLIKKNLKAVIDEFANSNCHRRIANKPLDYEVDSLERTPKRASPPMEYVDVSSSQPSPSLSAALPMDEEMTMRNAVIDTETGKRSISKCPSLVLSQSDTENEYELVVLKKGQHFYKLPFQRNKGYNLVSEVYVNNGYDYNSSTSTTSDSNSSTMEKRELKVCYGLENQPGKLMIEVEDCLDNYIPVNDSDNFEPDTLDRKSSKNSKTNTENYVDSLERPQQILLRTTGSFRKNNTINQTLNTFNRNFGSLREIYEAKNKGRTSAKDNHLTVVGSSEEEEKLLTLEERHRRRQRRMIPPDVIPPLPVNRSPIYDLPKPPRKLLIPDNLKDKPPLPPKNGKNRSANLDTSSQKKPSSIGIPEKDKKEVTIIQKEFIPNNNNEQLILAPNAPLKNLQSIIDNELKKNWVENELNNNNRNFDKITNTEEMLVNSRKSTNIKRAWQKFVDTSNQGKPEDSGYLSTDSNESRTASGLSRNGSQNDKGSETDESVGECQSESGGESIETHSVFFGRFKKSEYRTVSLDSGVDTDQKSRDTSFAIIDDSTVHSSDSENASYATVVPLDSTNST